MERFSNNAQTTLNGAMDGTTDPITFNVTDGSVFPSGGNFRVRINDEILKVTARSSNSLTADRAQEGTTKVSHGDGTAIYFLLTAAAVPQAIKDFCTKGTLGSKPASARKGHIYLTTDSSVLYYDDGSNLIPYGPIFNLTEPDNSQFSWINQATATISTTGGGLLLEKATQDTNKYSLRKKTAPGAPYKIDIAFIMTMHPSTTWRFGFGFRQSSDGKLHLLELQGESLYTALGVASAKYTNESTFSANYVGDDGSNGSSTTPPLFLRIEDDNTNRKLHWSHDGLDWIQIDSIGRTDFLTADEVCFGLRKTSNNTNNQGVRILSWWEH